MRIGHYAPRIWAKGGIATYIRRTGRAQEAQGHEVVYLSDDSASEEEMNSFPHEPVASDQGLFERARDLELDILHLHRAVEDLPADRVPTVRTMHGHQAGCPSATRYLSRPGSPCNRDYTVAGCLWGHFVDRCGSVRPQRLLRSFTRIHHEIDQTAHVPTYTVSDFLREKMIEAGCAPDDLHTIPSPAPAVDTAFTPVPTDKPIRFLYMGRLTPEKGADWLIRSMAQVPGDIHLDVAGSGPKQDELESLAQELGVRDCIAFHGWVNPDDIPALAQQARAIVFPSVWQEPAGLVSLEAAAYGRPLIASAVGGIPEYARDEYALLVEPRDMEGLADAMTQLAQAPERANQMGRAGRELAETEFTMARFLDRLDAFYETALEQADTPSFAQSTRDPDH